MIPNDCQKPSGCVAPDYPTEAVNGGPRPAVQGPTNYNPHGLPVPETDIGGDVRRIPALHETVVIGRQGSRQVRRASTTTIGTDALVQSSGAHNEPPFSVGDGLLPTIVTPGDARARLEAVNGYITALDQRIKQDAQLIARETMFFAQWSAFVLEWANYKRDHDDVWWTAASVMNECDRYQMRAEEWRRAWEKKGAFIDTPRMPEPEKPVSPSELLNQGASAVGSVATAVAVATLVIGAVLIVREVR